MGTQLFEYKNQKVDGFPFKFIRYNKQGLRQQLHKHDYIQIAYVMKGVCCHRFRGKSLTVGKGDIFIIPPGIEHSLNAFEGKEFEIVLVDFMPLLVHDEMKSFSDSMAWYTRDYKDEDNGSEVLLPWLHISKDKQLLVEQLLMDIQDEFEHREAGYEFSTRINLMKLLILIDRESRKGPKRRNTNPEGFNLRPFGSVIKYICDNYSEDIPLEKAAELVNMTPAYFSHAFKKESGQSFVDFVHEVRIERAMELIRHEGNTMTQVCFQVGFRHLSHFIRTFKKRTGLTPTEYKKMLRPMSNTAVLTVK